MSEEQEALTSEQEQEQQQTSEGQESAQAQESDADERDDAVTDRHGQPGINREKYLREMKERDDKIAELQAQVEKASESKEAREALEGQITALKQEMADKDVENALKLAGVRNVKAARALLDDHDGDVTKLKEAEPWLFETKQTGATGVKPYGGTADGIDAKIDKAMGIKKKG